MDNKISIVLVFLLLFSVGFVMAAYADNVNVQTGGMDISVDGDDVSVRGNGVDVNSNENGTSVGAGNVDMNVNGNQVRIRVRDGSHVGEDGQMIKIQTQANNRVRIEAGNVSVDCDCGIEQEMDQNRTRLYTKLSNGKNTEIKVMPDSASENALARLRLKVCSEDNNCSLELKEVGEGERARFAYEINTNRKSKVLGLFSGEMQVRAQVDAETGEVIDVNKPWWAFLASEPKEE
jgi:hypothetical protein